MAEEKFSIDIIVGGILDIRSIYISIWSLYIYKFYSTVYVNTKDIL